MGVFLERKTKVIDHIKTFKETLHFDHGGEHVSNEFEEFLKENGIRHQRTTHYTPQQNGFAERKNRTIMDLARSMWKAKRMPNSFWVEAVACDVYLLNCASSKSI